MQLPCLVCLENLSHGEVGVDLAIHHRDTVLVCRVLVVTLLTVDIFPKDFRSGVHFEEDRVAHDSNFPLVPSPIALLLLGGSAHEGKSLFDEVVSEAVTASFYIMDRLESVWEFTLDAVDDGGSVVVVEIDLHL